jgi:ABC-2 type transport system permease protein
MVVRSESQLQAVTGSWLRGFRAIYNKELARHFGNKRFISQLVLWCGLSAFPAIGLTSGGTTELAVVRGTSLLTLFLWLGTTPMSIGTIILSQGAIIEEKMTQTLLWICSKPLSRPALILGKFAAYAVFIGSIVLGIPAIITYITALIYGLPPLTFLFGYIVSILINYLLLLFLLALTLMLGACFNHVGTVTAIAFFVYIVGASLNSNQQLQKIEPYTFSALQRYAVEIVSGRFAAEAWIAMSTTLLLTILFLLIAFWQMERYEL